MRLDQDWTVHGCEKHLPPAVPPRLYLFQGKTYLGQYSFAVDHSYQLRSKEMELETREAAYDTA